MKLVERLKELHDRLFPPTRTRMRETRVTKEQPEQPHIEINWRNRHPGKRTPVLMRNFRAFLNLPVRNRREKRRAAAILAQAQRSPLYGKLLERVRRVS